MSENTAPPEKKEPASESFMSHLFEMRDRLMRMMLAILLIFLSLFYWANQIYTYLAQPLIRHLPEGSSMIAIDVASPFLTPFKLVLMLSVFLAMPVILYQLWAFVAPGLYKHEKRLAIPLLISSVLLFYLGIAFAYYVVFPLIFGFFTSIGPADVAISTDIGRYLDFVLSIFFGFGLAFEVPIATIIVIAIGLTTPDNLATKRPYVVVAAFIMGMLLTPPDVISQLLLAIPMWLLFECGLLAARYLLPEKFITQPLTETEVENSIGGSAYDDDYEVVDDPADSTTNSSDSEQNDSTTDDNNNEHVYDENDDDDYDSLDEDEYKELTEDEMDAELDRIDDDENYDDEEGYDDEPEPSDNDTSNKDGKQSSKDKKDS